MDLTLAVKEQYFNEIKSGAKKFEYRLMKPYWEKRLWHRHYNNVIITLGYPKKEDTTRRLVFPWNGCVIKTIEHPHFGNKPVDVYAVILKGART